LSQDARGLERPIWLAQKFPRKQHHIRPAIADDLISLRRLGDATDRRGRDACLLFIALLL